MAARVRRKNDEARLHRAVAQFLTLALRPPTIWTTLPVGGGGLIRGAQLKAMGVQRGWPDVLIISFKGINSSTVVGIELKTQKGRQSAEQYAIERQFTKAGGFYYVARSSDEVEGFLRGVGIPLHATTMRAAA